MVRQAFLNLLILLIFLENAITWWKPYKNSISETLFLPSFHITRASFPLGSLTSVSEEYTYHQSEIKINGAKLWFGLHQEQIQRAKPYSFNLDPSETAAGHWRQKQHTKSGTTQTQLHRDKNTKIAHRQFHFSHTKFSNKFHLLTSPCAKAETYFYCTVNW